MNDKLFEAMKTMGILGDYNVEEQMKMAIGSIKLVRKYAEAMNQLDEQWYLNFLDEINELSIDQDRPEAKYLGNNKIEINGEVYDLQ